MEKSIAGCTLCPRNCHADRAGGKAGFCMESNEIKLARAALHMWEEPCISGEEGSGAVFFSGCNLRCVFCQNHQISTGEVGMAVSVSRLAEIFLELAGKEANNINLVTPSHYVPQIIEALIQARQKGLTLPVVYNSSAYEKVETLRLLEGIVDIYLPDLKYYSSVLSEKYSGAADYFPVAGKAIQEMVRQTGAPVLNEKGLMKKGVLIRHLALPGCIEDSKEILRYLYKTYGNKILVSIMNQYTPLPQVAAYPELNRRLSEEEYEELVDFAIDLGIEEGYIQEGDTVGGSFIPAFDYEGVK